METRQLEIRKIGRENRHLIPGEMLAHRQCRQCLHWEDEHFWEKTDPAEILETRKERWFDEVSSSWGTCGMAAVLDGDVVAFTEYALPKYFPGLSEESLQPSPEQPFVACFVVRPEVQGQGVGEELLRAVENDLKDRGFSRVQAIARKGEGRNPAGPAGFWAAEGYETVQDGADHALMAKGL